MKRFISSIVAVMYSTSVLFGISALVPKVVLAHEGEEHSTAQEATEHEAETKQTDTAVYTYVAQPGDSYTLMARKAIQTYGIKNKSKLSRAKIIAAETWLTQAAGSPALNLAEKVQIKESSVKDTVDKALKITAAEEAAWAVYVSGANFNTNAVGQVAK